MYPIFPELSCGETIDGIDGKSDLENLQIFVHFLNEQQVYFLMLFSLIFIVQIMMTVHNILVFTYYKFQKKLILDSFYLSFLYYGTSFINQSLFVIL